MNVPWSTPDIGGRERDAVQRVLDSGWVSLGKETDELERELRQFIRVPDVVVLNNGTSALTAALLLHNSWNPYKKKHLPAYTYQATLNAIYASGGGQHRKFGVSDIQYLPVNPRTVLVHPPKTPTNDIYIPVSYAGLPLNKDDWKHLPDVVEDAAESFGASSNGVRTGGQGWDTVFSFHAAKLISMIEGGAVAVTSREKGRILREIRNQGESLAEKGVFNGRGFNFKPSDIHSAVGRVQLRKVFKYIDQRERVTRVYKEVLGEKVSYQEIPDYVERHGNMMFPVFIDDPVKVSNMLKVDGVSTRVGWKPLISDAGAEYVYNHVLCLPLYNTMTVEEAEYVSFKLLEAIK